MAQEDSGDTGQIQVDPTVLAEPARPAETPSAKPDPAPRRGGFWGPFTGGVLAAAAGFGAAQLVPAGWPLFSTSGTQAQIAAQEAEIAALKTDLAALAAAPQADAGLQAQVADLAAKLAAQPAPVDLSPLEGRLTTLESRLTAVESVPIGEGGMSAAQMLEQAAALGQLQEQVRALQSSADAGTQTAAVEAMVKDATAATDSMKAEAAQILRSVRQTAAIAKVQMALDLGGPFAFALPDLGEVPTILTETATTGVPTLSSLQMAFPSAARAGLEAALRADMGSSWTERATNFLRAQTGARSLEPREGDDPDAILSRAEAAVSAGDLAAALTEIAALPEPAQTAMADWTASAHSRQAVVAAVAQLAQSVQE